MFSSAFLSVFDASRRLTDADKFRLCRMLVCDLNESDCLGELRRLRDTIELFLPMERFDLLPISEDVGRA